MENIREHVYLAALLHDIGKFYQRADTGSVKDSQYLTSGVRNLKEDLQANIDAATSYEDILWTVQFIIDNESILNNLVGFNAADLSLESNPFSYLSSLGKLIKEANSLASDNDYKDDKTDSGAFKTKRLSSIFESIRLNTKQLSEQPQKYQTPVHEISLSDQSFPRNNFESSPDYESLWSAFTREFKAIPVTDCRSFSETLLSLLFKYAWCIPTSTANLSDVSMYDHAKMTAALAICLYDHEHDSDKNENPFMLVGADFSGIQSYIYQIVSKYAAKSLKGRSFYLRILSDAVVNYILKELNLFRANIIYNSGGSFYLLAPNTRFVREKLHEIMETIEQKMFNAHGTVLYLAIDHVELSREALIRRNGEDLTKVWTELFNKRDDKKNRKLGNIVSNSYATFFEPTQNGIETDKITGEEISRNVRTYDVDDIGRVRQLTYQQIDLGKRLRESDILLVSDKEIPHLKSKNPIEPAGLGIFFYLLKGSELKQALDRDVGSVSIITLNGKNGKCEFLQNEADAIYGLEFYGGNYFDGRTFDEFCTKESKDTFRRLGVLRMDVDNLGAIFQQGIPSEKATLARYAALSRSFDYFFSGYINTIQQKVAPNSSFIVYSGGDDLFIVASWVDAIKLAKKIRSDFSAFTCNNSSFSLSGGIALITPKFPIMRGAKDSEDEEKSAKNHECGDSIKNAISFMKTPLNWDKEFPVVEKLKNKIVELTNRKALPKSFIGKISQHLSSAKIDNHKIGNLRISWLVPYDMGRMISRHTDIETKQLIDNYKKEVCSSQTNKLNDTPITTSYHSLELWALAARWAELEIRTNK